MSIPRGGSAVFAEVRATSESAVPHSLSRDEQRWLRALKNPVGAQWLD